MFNIDLWKVSGHYKNYKDDLYLLPSDQQWLGIKPMNCPSHCLIYNNKTHSYRDLPLKIADFGVLHRNELTGALSGLTRVRRF
jgi:threonyl-tRNA synthetase